MRDMPLCQSSNPLILNYTQGFMGVCGFMLSDVMCDALIVERSKIEPDGRVGHMQGVGYVSRYVGNVLGTLGSMLLYNKEKWHWGLNIQQVFFLNGIVAVLFVFPFMYHLNDPNSFTDVRGIKDQLKDIWHMVQRRTIYRPMAFVGVSHI